MMAIIGFTACSSSDDDKGGGSSSTSDEWKTSSVTGIKNLDSSMLGSWDEGYATKKGVFFLKENGSSSVSAKKRKAEASTSTGKLTKTIYFSTLDGSTKATLLVSKETYRPILLVMGDGTLNFSFLNDHVLELVFNKGSELFYVDQIEYDKDALDAALKAASYTNSLQPALFYFAKVVDVKKVASYPTVVAIANYFKEVIGMTYSDTEVTAAEAEVAQEVVKDADLFESTYVKKVESTISVWTGKASFKVGGSSCTLSGTVFCADPSFVDSGEFGIVCDKSKDNLVLGKAEFEGAGELTDDANFDVDFRGLSPTSTYYYRAYYKFNNGATKYGDLTLDPSQVEGNVAYDKTIKSFETDENKLTVDVVMCMDISGSMGDMIDMVKDNALSFYTQFKEKCDAAGIQLRGLNTSVITYSDINVDGAEALSISKTYDLTDEDQLANFNSYVDSIPLSFGGDTPESGLEALMAAFDRDWGVDDGYHRQVVILWTDASYKTENEGIWTVDSVQMYTPYSYDEVKAAWDAMPTGRRMILFAPTGTSGYSNEGDWALMDDWKNVIRRESTATNLTDFGNSLDHIISELTGKEETKESDSVATAKSRRGVHRTFRPNR